MAILNKTLGIRYETDEEAEADLGISHTKARTITRKRDTVVNGHVVRRV